MYGSSFTRETLILRDSRIAAREAAAMPFPREETTPPVTKTYLVMTDLALEIAILLDRLAYTITNHRLFRGSGMKRKGVAIERSELPVYTRFIARRSKTGGHLTSGLV